ncbi:LamG-like jellyroll fold domain-containing protein [Albibacterium profundi]|uniref:LamG-like jellyroll fold domain-containing protein n=1 Tax=Albibacterium profundi TaxID=3134906 RepID=A0ABV5CCL6_9SPHI
MSRNIINYMINRTVRTTIFLLSIVAMTSCNTDFPNLLNEEYPDNLNSGVPENSQVLLVIVDGIKGSVLLDIDDTEIPNISEMSRNSIYSYGSLADFEPVEMGNASGWTTLMTGVTSSKHAVIGEDFTGIDLNSFPTVLSRIKETRPESRTAAFGASSEFISHLAEDAVEKARFDTDESVKEATVAEIQEHDAELIITQFGGVETAGKTFGYDPNAIEYVRAISNVDALIAELKDAIMQRPEYSRENWMIIITSGKGDENDGTIDPVAYNDESRNTFTMIYSPKFSSRYIPKPDSDNIPYVGFSPVYYGSNADNVVATLADEDAYNIGMDDYTIQFNVKGDGNARSWPVFLSKSNGINTAAPGWLIYMSGVNWSMNVSGNGSWQNFGSGVNVNDGEWHTITVVFYSEGSSRKLKMFTNGERSGDIIDITGRGALNSVQPLRIGRNGAGDVANPNLQITNLQIYDAALPDDVVASTACNTAVTEAHPYYTNLVGYWPSGEGSGDVLENHAPIVEGNNFKLSGAYRWESFVDVSPNLCPPVNDAFYQVVPNSVDLTFQIYTWLGIRIPESWGLDGKAWTPSYTNIRP